MKNRMKNVKKNRMKDLHMKTRRSLWLGGILLLWICLLAIPAMAAPTDRIHDFTITVDVNEDASLNRTYHIDWEVLDDSIGKLEWIDLGVPNRYHENITAISSTIDHIVDNGTKLAIYLDRARGKGESVVVDFSMKQDRMYQIDKWNEGETAYTFTPAWFDGIQIDSMTIRWNEKNTGGWQPDCLQEDGYLVFQKSLSPGSKFTISVMYPNDAFGFVPERQTGSAGTKSGGSSENLGVGTVILGLFGLGIILLPFILLFKFLRWLFGGIGFGSGRQSKRKLPAQRLNTTKTARTAAHPVRKKRKNAPTADAA